MNHEAIYTVSSFFTFVLCFHTKQWDSTIHCKASMPLSPYVTVLPPYKFFLYTVQSYFGRLKCTEVLFLLLIPLANPWFQLYFTLIITLSSTVTNCLLT